MTDEEASQDTFSLDFLGAGLRHLGVPDEERPSFVARIAAKLRRWRSGERPLNPDDSKS